MLKLHMFACNREIAEHIASATNIDNVVNKTQDMLGHVDAVLLARDDAENHWHLAKHLFISYL